MPKHIRSYRGYRLDGKCIVTVDGKPLNPMLEILNYSPSGFEWGFSGAGPSQLAFAILADLYGVKTAESKFQVFKNRIVKRLPETGWNLTEKMIRDSLEKKPLIPHFIYDKPL